MKTKPNGITFHPDQQPGSVGRNFSLDSVVGGAGWPCSKDGPTNDELIVAEARNPITTFKSMQNPWTKPSMILRKNGYEPY